MKKIYSIAALSLTLFAGSALAQSQRYILAEEFTQASCAPCAAQNPAFNAVLNANETKIIGLKYQVWWPGFDPMYNQNKSEVNTRVAYYSVTGVPNARVDGTAYAGAPSGVSQAFVDNRYNTVSSPYTISATHSFNASYTQMTINADITCTGATSGALVLQTAMIERQIDFTSAPGSNGELTFYGVMKKMVPDDQGTAVTAVSTGATQSVSLTVNIPWYVYNLNQLAAVLFIQDNTTKAVQQAAYSSPIGGLPAVDMQISTVTGIPTLICAGSFSPVITLKNNNATTISSCNVNYQIDGGAVVSQAWTGSLAQNATAQVTLNNLTAGNGTHTLNIFTSDLDAGVDISPVNNNYTKSFSFSINAALPPVVEGFTAATFPPTDWIINDNNADGIGWTRTTAAGGFGNSTQSARMDFFNSTNGRIDELFVKKIDMQGFTGTASLDFNVAYKQYAAENDRLEVLVSTNCGSSWTSLFNKAGSVLSTSPGGITTLFVPTASQWRAETIDLTSYLGQAEVLIKFKATSNYGNDLYIDDINMNVTTSIAESLLDKAVKVYPTLTSGIVTIDASFTKEENLQVIVYNAVGQQISSNSYGKTLGGQFTVDLSTVANGNYSVKIITDEAAIVKSVSVAK